MHDQSDLALRNTARLKRGRQVGISVVAALVVIGLATRLFSSEKLKSQTLEQAMPTVSVLHPSNDGEGGSLSLPGSIEAWLQAPVYARINGYLKNWYVDIGTPVQAGQLLAEVDAPDVDQQVTQAKADLATAQAQQELAAITAKRWDKLVEQDAVSKQEADEKRGDLAAKTAMVNAARANMDRLRALQGFKRIIAPFDGTVTSRATDVGALIIANSAAAMPLFTVADTKKMRVYVRIPQSYAARIQPGISATLSVPEYLDRTFAAQLVRTAGAVNDQSGTVLVQLVADNSQGLLKPGSYTQVVFNLPATKTMVRIPASALIFRKDGMMVAAIDQNNRVIIKPIRIAQDLGAEIEVASGLSTTDWIVDSPPDALADGDQVHIFKAGD